MRMSQQSQCGHSRPQSLRSFWPAAGIESSGSNHFERTKEITEFWLSGSLRICIYGACLKWLLPELSFSDRWSKGTRLWERDCSVGCINLVPRASVTLVQRNGKTKTSGKMRLSSAFHWPLTERAQFHRKLINNNFVPRFPILSRAGWMYKLWVRSTVRSLQARTWRTKQSFLRHIINNTFVDAVISASSAIVMIFFGLN